MNVWVGGGRLYVECVWSGGGKIRGILEKWAVVLLGAEDLAWIVMV